MPPGRLDPMLANWVRIFMATGSIAAGENTPLVMPVYLGTMAEAEKSPVSSFAVGTTAPENVPNSRSRSGRRHLYQLRHDTKQDHARGRAAPLRIRVSGHLRRQLPRQGKDQIGRAHV